MLRPEGAERYQSLFADRPPTIVARCASGAHGQRPLGSRRFDRNQLCLVRVVEARASAGRNSFSTDFAEAVRDLDEAGRSRTLRRWLAVDGRRVLSLFVDGPDQIAAEAR
jgi:hypothetical protein